MARLLSTAVIATMISAAVGVSSARAQSSVMDSPAMREALARFKVRSAAEDRAADVAKASGHWSGSAQMAQAGPLQTGQDLTNAERVGIASLCHEVAKAMVNSAFIRVDKGAPNPRLTCKLRSGVLITIVVDREGDPHRAR
jgi:hypothetical protein